MIDIYERIDRSILLTELAMNLEEWPRFDEVLKGERVFDANEYLLWSPVSGGDWFAELFDHNGERNGRCVIYTELQWIERRERLINRPPSFLAPKWANWMAQSKDGDWYWCSVKPVIASNAPYWYLGEEPWVTLEHAATGKIPKGHDWRGTRTRIIERGDW